MTHSKQHNTIECKGIKDGPCQLATGCIGPDAGCPDWPSPPPRDPLSVKDATQESSAKDDGAGAVWSITQNYEVVPRVITVRQGTTRREVGPDPAVMAAVSAVAAFVDRVMDDETLPAGAPILNLEMLALLRHTLALVQIAVTKNDRAEALKQIETAWLHAAMLKVDR